MPNPSSPAMFGLQKAASIGADPRAERRSVVTNAVNSAGGVTEAGMPTPENEGLGALDALSKLARQYTGPVQETLGEMNPFYTPVGGEGMYNVDKVKAMPHMPDEMYQRMLSKFGMGRK